MPDARRTRNALQWVGMLVICVVAFTHLARGDDEKPRKTPQVIDEMRREMDKRLRAAEVAARAGDLEKALELVDRNALEVDRGADAVFAAARSTRAAPSTEAPKQPTPARVLPVGSAATRAITEALNWLAAHQAPNGSWPPSDFARWCDGKQVVAIEQQPEGRGNPKFVAGVTGLALSAFVGAGYGTKGKHPYSDVVAKALRYLTEIQDAEGCYGPRNHQQYIYGHGTCALAMVEAYELTGSGILRASAQRAIDFIKVARNPFFAWRYGVQPGDNDTSISGWMMSVLNAARRINDRAAKEGKSAPFVLDASVWKGMKAWLDKVTDSGTGRVGYVLRGSGSARTQKMLNTFPADRAEALTAASVLARLEAGEDPTSPLIRKGVLLCAGKAPRWNERDGSIDMYYWYYGTRALARYGGELWRTWKRALAVAVLSSQRRDGTACTYKGSWNPAGPWGPDGGRVYATALLTRTLTESARN